jgi:hypothetical protein
LRARPDEQAGLLVILDRAERSVSVSLQHWECMLLGTRSQGTLAGQNVGGEMQTVA